MRDAARALRGARAGRLPLAQLFRPNGKRRCRSGVLALIARPLVFDLGALFFMTGELVARVRRVAGKIDQRGFLFFDRSFQRADALFQIFQLGFFILEKRLFE